MVADFYAYEKALGDVCLAPLLERHGLQLQAKAILDVGCGYGGVLSALAERFRPGKALGIDLDAEMVRSGQAKVTAGVRLEVRDFFHMGEETFDLIVIRDVLEHIVNVEAALETAWRTLKPGGKAYVSFAPFYSPFGGHQHNAAGIFSYLPWLQFLSADRFRRLLRLEGNSYKSGRSLDADIESVLRTRLTLAGFRRTMDRTGFHSIYYRQYLVRPDYRLKFGLRPILFPVVPLVEEILCTGAEALLERA